MSSINPTIDESWKQLLHKEFQAEYFKKLKAFLVQEKQNHQIFPPGAQIFTAFNLTPYQNVKVVIIGQDPYHGPNQAHGLCFSVAKGIKKPPSLVNIFKELKQDLEISIPENGNLDRWANQGVLLLNASLTVRAHQAGSHQNKGWEIFTDAVIKQLSSTKENLIFLLWGNFAIAKKELIDESKHYILSSAHPSPFSAHRGFLGNQHFSKTNSILKELGQDQIDWRIE